MKVYYGSECTCEACTQSPAELMLSDARRNLFVVLEYALKGREPSDIDSSQARVARSKEATESPFVLAGIGAGELARPLTRQQITAYLFMCAGLVEAEGIVGLKTASYYSKAATELFGHTTSNATILLPSVKLLVN